MNVRPSGVLYVALVQLAFSALDIFARMSLKHGATFFDAVGRSWFIYWLCMQAVIAPFQIRLITQHGLGRGVALMNAFSVLYACIGGYVIAHEALRPQDVIAACLVVFATYLFVVRRPVTVAVPQILLLPEPAVVGAAAATGVLNVELSATGSMVESIAAGAVNMKNKPTAKRRRGRKARARRNFDGPSVDAVR